MIPTLLYNEHSCCFRTLNSNLNPSNFCLFDGARLEVSLSSSCITPEFGFCFPRRSFVLERDRLDLAGLVAQPAAGDWMGWEHREPSDSERTCVNKKGREILYFLRPPPATHDVMLSELRAEIGKTLNITDLRRISFTAGPFFWPPEFREDGRGLYCTYFNSDIVVDSQHMLTSEGAALIDVLEKGTSLV